MRTWIMVGLHTFGFLSLAGLMAACTPTNPEATIGQAIGGMNHYVDAKRAYTAAMSKYLQNQPGYDSRYQLVSIVGPQWQIGTAIQADNFLNILTNKCVFPDAALPKTGVNWSDFPESSSTRTISFGAGLPQSILKALKKDSKIDASFKRVSTGQFSLTNISSIIMPEDDFNSQRSTECQQVIDARDVYLVRGVISGKEVFKSGGQLERHADFKILDEELLKFAYDDKGDFVLEDTAPKPKIYLMAYFPHKPQKDGEPSLPVRAPTRDEIDRLENHFK